MQTIYVKPETADKIREFATLFGMVPSDAKEISEGKEAIHLPDDIAAEFEKRRKAAKVSADTLILRLFRNR